MTGSGHRPPLREELSLYQATVAREGITTAAGAAAGNSIIDAGLIGIGANSYVSMLMVVFPGDFNLVDSMDITAFNNVTGEVTLNRAYKGVAAAIDDGVRYKIVTFRFVPAEVAAIVVSLGRILVPLDFEGEGLVQVQINAAGVTVALPNIIVHDLPAGATVQIAKVWYKYRMIENPNVAVNALNGATVALTSQVVQIRSDAPTAYVDAINYPDNFHTLAGSAREGGDVDKGTLNVASTVDENDTYNLRLLLGRADLDFINFEDVQVGLRLWYSL